MKKIYILSISALSLFYSCSKSGKEEDGKEQAAQVNVPYFKSGNGFNYLATYTVPTSGSFNSSGSLAMSLTDDGKLHWLFYRNADLFRKTLNATSGDTLAVEGNLNGVGARLVNNSYDGAQPDKYYFVPYTNKLYRSYRSGQAEFKVIGDIQEFKIGGYDGKAIQPVVYANGDILMHYAGNISANLGYITTMIGAYISHNGILSGARVEKTLASGTRISNYDKLYHGGITFPADNNGSLKSFGFTNYKAYLFMHNGTSSTAVDSIDYAGIPFNDGSVVPNVPFFAKTSKDMTKTIILCYEPDDRKNFTGKYKYSTFVIDNSSNKIKLVVNKALMPLGEYDFDTEGNIYFADNTYGSTKVLKADANGLSTLAENFFGNTAIAKIHALGGKVYLVANSSSGTEAKISVFVSK